MSRKLRHTFLKLLALVPLLLTMAPAMAQDGNAVYAGQTTVLAVEEVEGVTYTWELYNNVEGINLAVTPGNCPDSEAYFVDGIHTGATVEVMWLVPGTYFFKVTAEDGCSNNLKLGRMEVLESLPVAYFLEEPEPICIGDPGFLTIELAGAAPWTIEYTVEFDGNIETETISGIQSSPHTFEVFPEEIGTYTYTITSVTDANGVTNDELTGLVTVTLVVEPRPFTSPIERYDPLTKTE